MHHQTTFTKADVVATVDMTKNRYPRGQLKPDVRFVRGGGKGAEDGRKTSLPVERRAVDAGGVAIGSQTHATRNLSSPVPIVGLGIKGVMCVYLLSSCVGKELIM